MTLSEKWEFELSLITGMGWDGSGKEVMAMEGNDIMEIKISFPRTSSSDHGDADAMRRSSCRSVSRRSLVLLGFN